jgi:hypothetical protein
MSSARRAVVVMVMVSALVAGACGSGSPAPTGEATAGSESATPSDVSTDPSNAKAVAILEETIASFDPENLEPMIAEAAVLDRQIELEMAEWSGLEDALGGPDATAAAFATHDAMYAPLASTLEAPTQFGFRRSQADGPSVGAGLFGGYMVVALGSKTLVERSNDGETGTFASDDGTMTAEATDTSVKLAMDVTHDADGVTTKLKTNVTVVPCPDVNGELTVEAIVDVSASAGGTTQNGKLEVRTKIRLDDNAEVIDKESDFRLRRDGLGMGAFVDTSVTLSTARASSVKVNDFNWFTTRPEHVESNVVLASIFGVLVEHFLLDAAKSGYESGRCVRLAYALSAGPSGLAPGSSVTITATPKSKQDGTSTGGNVSALLTGGEKAVDPSSTPLPADATFEYSAPGEPDKTGTVSLEARSKRGVGRASIDFDTKQPAAYQVVGGLDDWQTNTAVCDIMKPFTLTGILTMTMSGGTSGTYEYSGGPFGAAGTGTYEIAFPNGTGQAGTMVGSGDGTVETPLGQASNSGTEQYTLTPIPPCE